MFKKVKEKFAEIKEETQRKREECERIAREQAEEEVRIEHERIQAEKGVLMTMSEKELMVEAIMALRGYSTRLTIIEEQQDGLYDRVATLELGIRSLESNVSSIKSSSE